MLDQKIFDQIRENLNDVTNKSSELGIALWNSLLEEHPADIAQFLTELDIEDSIKIYLQFPKHLKTEIFGYFSDAMKATMLTKVPDDDKTAILDSLPLHEMVDFIDMLSDDDLKNIFRIMHKKDRKQVIELMKFGTQSAGGIMDTDVISFTQDLTVEKAIQILQKIQPKKEIHQEIYPCLKGRVKWPLSYCLRNTQRQKFLIRHQRWHKAQKPHLCIGCLKIGQYRQGGCFG